MKAIQTFGGMRKAVSAWAYPFDAAALDEVVDVRCRRYWRWWPDGGHAAPRVPAFSQSVSTLYWGTSGRWAQGRRQPRILHRPAS